MLENAIVSHDRGAFYPGLSHEDPIDRIPVVPWQPLQVFCVFEREWQLGEVVAADGHAQWFIETKTADRLLDRDLPS